MELRRDPRTVTDRNPPPGTLVEIKPWGALGSRPVWLPDGTEILVRDGMQTVGIVVEPHVAQLTFPNGKVVHNKVMVHIAGRPPAWEASRDWLVIDT